MESYFAQFRKDIIGIDQKFNSPYGEKSIVYTDWTASGRLYAPIENILIDQFYKYCANTHTETNITGTTMTRAYHLAHKIIKKHVNAGPKDVIITTGQGMTSAVNKFQRILGLRIPDRLKDNCIINEEDRPVVFVTHMEHHSNQTSWIETIAEVVVIEPDEQGLVNTDILKSQLEKYKYRKTKIGAFTGCSNVTGIRTNYSKLAKVMHSEGGLCFVDFACSAPYVNIDMHPTDESEKLDAIFFSPHKFLGGPGSSGVLIFDSSLYKNLVPDQPGGGTVNWTNPWGEYSFIEDIEAREDGGTPGFIQAIRTALAIKVKESMGVENMMKREEEILKIAFTELRKIPKVNILANNIEDRLSIISLYVDNVHYNLIVKLFNDLFGIQTRGGCSCAGTYGHFLLNVDQSKSHSITCKIDSGNLSEKPGWVRISFHPTTTDAEVYYVASALKDIVENIDRYAADYNYSEHTNEFTHKTFVDDNMQMIENWFDLVKK